MKISWRSGAILFCSAAIQVATIHAASINLAAQTPAAVKVPSVLDQSAIANEKSLIEAKKRNDTVFFKRTLSQNFSLVGVDGTLLQGEEAAENLGDSDLVELTPV